MAIETINIGTSPNDGTGDPLRVAFDKTNDNFLTITADGGNEITVLNPTTSTDTDLNVALQDILDAGGGGAVDSVNSQTGVVSIDLESVLTEGNTSTLPIQVANVQIFDDANADYGKFELNDGVLYLYDAFGNIRCQIGYTDSVFEMINPTTGFKWSIGQGAPSLTANRDYSIPNLSGMLSVSAIVTTNFNAVNDAVYNANGTLTVTDPTPIANKGFIVHVIGGSVTIGGVAYTSGALVYRYYNGSSWISTNMNNAITIDATPTDGSSNAVSSNGVFDTLALKTNKNRFVFNTKTSITGVATETNICSFKIEGGAYASTDGFKFDFTQYKGTTASGIAYRAYVGTTSGARTNQIMSSAIAGANRTGDVTRRYYIDGGSLDSAVPFTSNSQSGLSGFGTVNTPISVNMANDLWITITAQGMIVSETVGILGASITPLA